MVCVGDVDAIEAVVKDGVELSDGEAGAADGDAGEEFEGVREDVAATLQLGVIDVVGATVCVMVGVRACVAVEDALGVCVGVGATAVGVIVGVRVTVGVGVGAGAE